LDRGGYVKLCDFGISGYLVDSIAKTQDVGCQIYMAPERLSERRYDIRSDVWSLGISLVEICIGKFPYTWSTVFEQVQSVVHGDPPYVDVSTGYSIDLVNFVNRCLIKGHESRPKFSELMEDTFFKRYNFPPEVMNDKRREFGSYAAEYIEDIIQNRQEVV
jgi:serine/threonine protein kinase